MKNFGNFSEGEEVGSKGMMNLFDREREAGCCTRARMI